VDYKTVVGLGITVFLTVSLVMRSRRPQIPVWSIMAFTSFLTIVSGLVGLDELESVIDLDVILFLIGMFTIVGLAESSGLLAMLPSWFISMFKSRYSLIYASSLLFGLLAAVAMNDTVALMGPPIAYAISRVARIDPRAMFLLLAFSLTIGSVMTPIGNPQNVLIVGRSGIVAPFLKFVAWLSVPTLLNLMVTPYILIKYYKIKNERVESLLMPYEVLRNRRDALIAGVGIIVVIVSLVLNDLLELMGLPHVSRRGFIPFVVAAGMYMLSSNPRKSISNIDWGTIVFFITMFITMEGVWRSGILSPMLEALVPTKLEGFKNLAAVTAASVLGSQLLSNVPFARLFIKYLESLGYGSGDDITWIALAMSSTVAGNLTLLGAASNIIMLEYLESRMGTTITFLEFLKVGSLVTIANIALYLPFLALSSL
jgi:Na+/H+ antiporter NhaD/arsenite permease-like protein